MNWQRNTAQMKEQTRNTEVQINEKDFFKIQKSINVIYHIKN